jgi:hypothetical protein
MVATALLAIYDMETAQPRGITSQLMSERE